MSWDSVTEPLRSGWPRALFPARASNRRSAGRIMMRALLGERTTDLSTFLPSDMAAFYPPHRRAFDVGAPIATLARSKLEMIPVTSAERQSELSFAEGSTLRITSISQRPVCGAR